MSWVPSPEWRTDVAKAGLTSAFFNAKTADEPRFSESADHVLGRRCHPQRINDPDNLLRLFVEIGRQGDVGLPTLLHPEQTKIAGLQLIRSVRREKNENNIRLLTHFREC